MSLILFCTSILTLSLITYYIKLKTVWLSFFFGVLFFLFILKIKNNKKILQNNNKVQLIIASIITLFPFIISLLTFIEYGTLYNNFIPGILVMDMTLTFYQYFMTMPFSFFDSSKSSEQNIVYPLVSIIVPAYNEEKWIKKTLESLIEVDYSNKEIIVIDDGSIDKTHLIASNMMKKNKNIKVYKKNNGGKASAINYGLLVASGSIIVITDADGLISRNSLKDIVGYFQDPSVVGVAGNIKVINKNTILSNCQAIEYVVGINLYRAATASFGVIEVLPGPLSAFRRSAIEKVGRFDSDTIVEDADFTKKLQKTGNILQSTSEAYAFTEVPNNLHDFIKQRTRWYRGNIQTFLKHKDVRDFSANTFYSTILVPINFLQIFIQPFLGLISAISLLYMIFSGNFISIQRTFVLFLIMQVIISMTAINKGGEDVKLLLYSPFLIIGYKHLIDLIKVKCIINHMFDHPARWNKLERTGPNF